MSNDATADNKGIINQISVILRNGHFHNIDNVAVIRAIERLKELVDPVIEVEEILKIDLIGEFFFINGTRVRYPMEFMINYDYLAREFRRRDLGSILFGPVPSIDDITVLLKALLYAPFSNTPFNAIEAYLEHIETIQIGRPKTKEEDGEYDRRRVVKKSYFNAVSFIKKASLKMGSDQKASIKKAKRVVESMVDIILSEDQLFIGMTTIKDYDDYTYHHSVNVSVLSIAIGQKIGLSRKALTELGLVALFHDIGKTEIPKEILNKPTEFTEAEWKVMRKHPYWGARTILQIRGFDRISIQAAIVAIEHHVSLDHSGYPRLRETTSLDFYVKIVSIADQYDAMTSSRIYSRMPYTPDKALSILTQGAGTTIDPILLKVFVNMLGVYPVGSLVLLDTREMGLVCECNPLFSNRPRVMVIVDSAGKEVDGFVADLTERDDDYRYRRNIIKTLDPNRYRINLANYLM